MSDLDSLKRAIHAAQERTGRVALGADATRMDLQDAVMDELGAWRSYAEALEKTQPSPALKCAVCIMVKTGIPFDAVTVRGGTAVCEHHQTYASDDTVKFVYSTLTRSGGSTTYLTDADFVDDDDSEPEPQEFAPGDRVSWAGGRINTDVVYGFVTGRHGDEVRVTWADGSGPTWHKADQLTVLDDKEPK